MGTTPNSTSSPGPASRSSGVASAEKTGLHQPSDDGRIEDKLQNVDLQSRGSKVNDNLRDKRSNGIEAGYDDSINHNADQHYSQEKSVAPRKD